MPGAACQAARGRSRWTVFMPLDSGLQHGMRAVDRGAEMACQSRERAELRAGCEWRRTARHKTGRMHDKQELREARSRSYGVGAPGRKDKFAHSTRKSNRTANLCMIMDG